MWCRLGKTVQVMALIAYLMERKDNYGPHLIIVPNAVMVNWKSELTQWLPTVRCVYYVGHKVSARRSDPEVRPYTVMLCVVALLRIDCCVSQGTFHAPCAIIA